MYPIETKFLIKTVGSKKILCADTTYKQIVPAGAEYPRMIPQELIMSHPIGLIADKEYSEPLIFHIADGRIIFDDIEFIKIF